MDLNSFIPALYAKEGVRWIKHQLAHSEEAQLRSLCERLNLKPSDAVAFTADARALLRKIATRKRAARLRAVSRGTRR